MNIDREHIKGLEKYFGQKFKNIAHSQRDQAKALKIQAKEYKRRLKDLNGEADRLRNIQSSYIPREVFDRTVTEMRKEIDSIAKWKTAQEGRGELYRFIPTIINVVLALAMAMMAWMVYQKMP